MRLLLPSLLVLLLAACASLPERWPEGAPARAVFESAYAEDVRNSAVQDEDEYLMWVRRFYRGLPPVEGWLDTSQQVLAGLDPATRAPVAERLARLGVKISSEWAKSNELRRINTRVGNVWREALNEARRQNDLAAYLERLEADVDALLAGRLDPDLIRFERYYQDEFSF